MDKKQQTLTETALFLMDHTDWKKDMLDIGAYLAAVDYCSKPHGEFLDEGSAAVQIKKLWDETVEWKDWEQQFDEMVTSGAVPGSILTDEIELTGLLENENSIAGLIHDHYVKEKNHPRCKVFDLVGGKHAMEEIIDFALANASADYEKVYSQLRSRYCEASWYK